MTDDVDRDIDEFEDELDDDDEAAPPPASEDLPADVRTGDIGLSEGETP